MPADLVVTNVSIPPVNYSGEKMTFTYTVTNEGPNPVWPGTPYWTDFLWLSADPTFIRTRASFLGQTTHVQDPARCSRAQSYTVTYTVTLPPGTGGHYYLYIDLDAHNDLPPNLYTYQARLETTDWWPASTGDNSYWLGQFNHWAFEDPNNNRIATPFDITYREPDLKVTNITVPPDVTSGTTIPITYTVTNQGTRATRVRELDRPHLPVAGPVARHLRHRAGRLRLRPGPGGRRLVHRDRQRPHPRRHPGDLLHPGLRRLRRQDRTTPVTSNIGYDLYGVKIGAANELDPYDLVSTAVRSLGRGHVPQYENEADKLASVAHARHPGPAARPAGDRHQQRRQRGPRLPGPDARRHLHRHQRRRRHAADDADLERPDLLLGRHQPRPQGRPLPGDGHAHRTAWPPAPATPSPPRCRCPPT